MRRCVCGSGRRGMAAVLALALALGLPGCGGGAVVVGSGGGFSLGFVVGGRAVPDRAFAGQFITLSAQVGQPVEVDANEPVFWEFSVNGSALFGSGTSVQFNGLRITEVALSPSRVVLQTAVVGPAVLPAFVLLTATSTIDAARVVTVRLELR